jgi:hypothetical protein
LLRQARKFLYIRSTDKFHGTIEGEIAGADYKGIGSLCQGKGKALVMEVDIPRMK